MRNLQFYVSGKKPIPKWKIIGSEIFNSNYSVWWKKLRLFFMFMCNKRVSDWQDNVLQRGCSVPFLRTWLLNLAVIESQLHQYHALKNAPQQHFSEYNYHFYPRPVLAFGYCRCLRLSVCVSVCVCVNHVLVRAITHHPLKLGSPDLDHRCKRPWLRSLSFLGGGGGAGGGRLTLTFKVKLNSKVKIYPILSLSMP